jgi:uncharacterized protein
LSHLVTDLDEIKNLSAERETENDAFRVFLKSSDGKVIDTIVHKLNDNITPQIDCTACGNCCKSLMINVTKQEADNLAAHLQTTVQNLKEKYIEESSEGQMVVNKIPCHFLAGTKCSIYEHRFEGCREFPHLDRDNFTNRLFGIMMYYSVCPIIFNVVEALKIQLRFTTAPAE